MRAARHGDVGRRRRGAPGRAHDAGGDRPPAHVPRDARRRRRRVRDGDLLARARAAARRRDPRARPRCSPTSRQDHLDFHPTMEDYFQAKRLLFATRLPACGSPTPTTPTGGGWPRSSRTRVTFAIDARGRLPRARRALRRRRLRLPLRARRTASSRSRLPLPGRFNVLNALGALGGGARARRRAGADGSPRWPTPPRVPGRFEPVDEGQPFAVVVDYAHKPDALENVLQAARELADGPRDRRRSARAATATAASAR